MTMEEEVLPLKSKQTLTNVGQGCHKILIPLGFFLISYSEQVWTKVDKLRQE